MKKRSKRRVARHKRELPPPREGRRPLRVKDLQKGDVYYHGVGSAETAFEVTLAPLYMQRQSIGSPSMRRPYSYGWESRQRGGFPAVYSLVVRSVHGVEDFTMDGQTVVWLDSEELEPNIRAGTGADFDGQEVVVAYNLHNCRVNRDPQPGELCFTVRPSLSGRVLAHVDEILLRDVELLVRPSGLRRVRERGTREVFAFARGTALDPRTMARSGLLGEMVDWHGIAFNPFKDDTFVLREDRSIPILNAEFVYFRERRGIAKLGYEPNPDPHEFSFWVPEEIHDVGQLDELIHEEGGMVEG